MVFDVQFQRLKNFRSLQKVSYGKILLLVFMPMTDECCC